MSKTCSRRMFLLGTGTTFAAAYLAACGKEPSAQIAATEVPVGSGIIVDGVIFVQPKEGEFKAYSAKCTHENQQITQIEGMTATCVAHFTQYNLEDGSSIQGPGRKALDSFELENDGTIIKTKQA